MRYKFTWQEKFDKTVWKILFSSARSGHVQILLCIFLKANTLHLQISILNTEMNSPDNLKLMGRIFVWLIYGFLKSTRLKSLCENYRSLCISIAIDIRSIFDLIPIPIIITILIFVHITNQPAHNSQVDRPAFVAWMSMVMRMKNGNDFEIEYWPYIYVLRINRTANIAGTVYNFC